MNEELIQYFTNVLGIKQVMLPANFAESLEAPKARVVLFVDEKPWSMEATMLFNKMREAMKLSETEAQVIFTEQLGTAGMQTLADLQIKALTASAVVSFSENKFQDLKSENKFLTHGPESLLKNAQLKKEAWTTLQEVMKTLG